MTGEGGNVLNGGRSEGKYFRFFGSWFLGLILCVNGR